MNLLSVHRIFLLGLFLCLCVLVFPVHVSAQALGLSIQPIKISHTVNPGEVINGVITLKNASVEKVRVEVGVEDFIPSAGTTGVQFVGRAEGVTTVRDWIELDIPDEFEFEKEESRVVKYTITTPEDAEPGSHFGVAFFKALKLDEGSQLKIGTRVGVLMYITVTGEQVLKGDILDFKTDWFTSGNLVHFVTTFENLGNVHYAPEGTISIKNIFGKEVALVDFSGEAVLPTGVREITTAWEPDGMLFGRYTASIEITDGEGNPLTANKVAFYSFPIKLFGIFIGGIFLLYIIFRILKSKIKINIQINR